MLVSELIVINDKSNVREIGLKKVINLFFFFKQKTAYEIKECDWSSDVCSSDLS